MEEYKIIHILLGKANPERMNGVNVVVHNLATHQTSLGAEVEVWGITPTPDDSTTERSYKIILFKADRWKIDPALKREIARQPKKVIFHLHAGFITLFYPLTRLLSKYAQRYVITPHGNYMSGAMHKNYLFKRIYFQFFEKRILSDASFIHCLGEGEVDNIKKLTPGLNNIKIVPNGQDFTSFDFSYDSIQKSEMPVFGFCGRLTKYQKGLDLLLEAFKIYKTEWNGKGVLWLIGDGEYKSFIEKFISTYKLEDSVKLWGSRFGKEKLNLIANMDAFYHPSRNEGLPMAVLEASVLGIPLVVSQYTNMTSYVTNYNAGICLNENTPWDIANSMKDINSLVTAGNLKQLGNNARKMAIENFDWSVIAKKLIDAYADSK